MGGWCPLICGVSQRSPKLSIKGACLLARCYMLHPQHEALLRMRSDGELSNEMMNRILRELDLEESRLEI